MLSRIDDNRLPIPTIQAKPVLPAENQHLSKDPERAKDFVELKNRREIKRHYHYEKGQFVDIYA